MIASLPHRIGSRLSRAALLPIVLALALLPAAAPALAKTDGPHLPFRGTLQAVESGIFDPGPPVTVSVTATGSGNATQLGRFAYSYTVVIFFPTPDTRTGTLYYDFVAANGDHLYSVGAGFGVPAGDFDHVVEQHPLTGGTGRFAGAPGSFPVDRLISHFTSTPPRPLHRYLVPPNG